MILNLHGVSVCPLCRPSTRRARRTCRLKVQSGSQCERTRFRFANTARRRWLAGTNAITMIGRIHQDGGPLHALRANTARAPRSATPVSGRRQALDGDGARLGAGLLATHVREVLGGNSLEPKRNYRRETVTVARRPDILRMSRLPVETSAFPPENTTAYRVLDEAGEPLRRQRRRPDPHAGRQLLAQLPDRRARGGRPHRQPRLRSPRFPFVHRERWRRIDARAPRAGTQSGDP